MSDFNVRADAVDVEQIMRQIRARIREKRGVDYTEEQIQELARVRLEKFLDPKGLRSDLLEQFQRSAQRDVPPIYDFDDKTLFRSSNPFVAFMRRLLLPILKLFFSPNPLNHAMHLQTGINRYLLDRAARDVLFYEVLHNLVVEMTRTGIDVKNMQMRVESIAGRLDFNERRARALEAVVQYRPDALSERGHGPAPLPGGGPGGESAPAPSGIDPITSGESLRSRRRRRRRGRRSGPGFGGEVGSDERRTTSGERAATSDDLRVTSDGQGATTDERGQMSGEPRTPNRESNLEPGPTNSEPNVERRTANPEPGPEPRTANPEPNLEPRTTNPEPTSSPDRDSDQS
jgi:hypothetical protein